MHTAADKKVRLDAFSVAVEVFFVYCLFLWAGAKNTTAKTLGLIKNEWKTLRFHRSTGFGVNATLIIIHCEFCEKEWGGQFVKQSETFIARH